MGYRLDSGGLIDRNRTINFLFNGKKYQGFEGDTLASALIANGVSLTARSFKYHRPRGIIGAGVEEPGTLVELHGDHASGNRQATLVNLKEGLSARSVNCWPSPNFDVGAITQAFARFLPAGFYYKTFKWPNWHLYEPSIRKAAGLAGAPDQPPKNGRFENKYSHADVLVVGAGPAGLVAALTAARAGKRIMLVDEGTGPGGSLRNQRRMIDGLTGVDWADAICAELATFENVTHLQNSTVWGYREHNYLMINEREPGVPNIIERNWRVRVGHVITATGAIERPLVFGNNDRPGVMLASAVQAYVNRFATAPGHRAVIFTNNDSTYQVARDLLDAGVDVAAIVDVRTSVPPWAKELVDQCEILEGHVVLGAEGHKRVKRVTVEPRGGGLSMSIDCDLLAVSGGWNPAVHLFSQSRGTLVYDPDHSTFVAETPTQPVAYAGGFTLPGALKSGIDAAANLDGVKEIPVPNVEPETYSVEPLWAVPNCRGKAFVDIQNDVGVDDIQLALREGYSNVEHVKRYTTGGMGVDQGKTGNINILGIISTETRMSLSEQGTTTFRSPYTPVSFGAIGGLREETVTLPYRHTPITKWNETIGAVMYEAGARWRRPGYFPQAGEDFQTSVNREARTVREKVGVYDGSPLGKFELKGQDVGRFLDHLYTNMMSNLSVGHCRYGLMLTDDGLVLDDGVAMRLSEHTWVISTSTGNADAIHSHLEEIRQTRFPEWNIFITNVTGQWGNATICGPDARNLLNALGADIDTKTENFPFMTFRDCLVAGMAARIVRVSFTGELSFEINVGQRDLLTLWEKIMDVGKHFGVLPIGSEANHVLRVEKGFLSLGHEVDGTVDPYDLGMGWVMSKKKSDYLGKRSVELRRKGGQPRRELVGIIPELDRMVPEGAPITPSGEKCATEGFVTACVWSVVHERWVGLALLNNGHERHDEIVHVRLKDEVIPVRTTKPVHYDPSAIRMRL